MTQIEYLDILRYVSIHPVFLPERRNLMDLWLVLYWGGPIGLGIFFIGLGVLFMGIAKLSQTGKK